MIVNIQTNIPAHYLQAWLIALQEFDRSHPECTFELQTDDALETIAAMMQTLLRERK